MAPNTKWVFLQGVRILFCLLLRCGQGITKDLEAELSVSDIGSSNNPLRECITHKCPEVETFPQFLVCVMSFCEDQVHGKYLSDTGHSSFFPKSQNPEDCIQDGCQDMDSALEVKCHQICHKLGSKRDWVDPSVYYVKKGQGKRDWVDPVLYGKRDTTKGKVWVDPTLYFGGKRWVDPSVYSGGKRSWVDPSVYMKGKKGWVDPSVYGKRDWVDPTVYGKRDWVDPTVYGKRDWVDPTVYGKRDWVDPTVYGKRDWVDPTIYGKRDWLDTTVYLANTKGKSASNPTQYDKREDGEKDDWLQQVLQEKTGNDVSTTSRDDTTKEAKKWLDPMAYRNKRWLDPMTYRNNRAKSTTKGNKRSVESLCKGLMCKTTDLQKLTKKQQQQISAIIHCLPKCLGPAKDNYDFCRSKCLKLMQNLKK